MLNCDFKALCYTPHYQMDEDNQPILHDGKKTVADYTYSHGRTAATITGTVAFVALIVFGSMGIHELTNNPTSAMADWYNGACETIYADPLPLLICSTAIGSTIPIGVLYVLPDAPKVQDVDGYDEL